MSDTLHGSITLYVLYLCIVGSFGILHRGAEFGIQSNTILGARACTTIISPSNSH